MSTGPVDTIYVEIQAKMNRLEQGLQQAERQVATTGRRMNEAMVLPARAFGKEFKGAMKLIGLGGALHLGLGTINDLLEQANNRTLTWMSSLEILKGMPIFGSFARLGENIANATFARNINQQYRLNQMQDQAQAARATAAAGGMGMGVYNIARAFARELEKGTASDRRQREIEANENYERRMKEIDAAAQQDTERARKIRDAGWNAERQAELDALNDAIYEYEMKQLPGFRYEGLERERAKRDELLRERDTINKAYEAAISRSEEESEVAKAKADAMLLNEMKKPRPGHAEQVWRFRNSGTASTKEQPVTTGQGDKQIALLSRIEVNTRSTDARAA